MNINYLYFYIYTDALHQRQNNLVDWKKWFIVETKFWKLKRTLAEYITYFLSEIIILMVFVSFVEQLYLKNLNSVSNMFSLWRQK